MSDEDIGEYLKQNLSIQIDQDYEQFEGETIKVSLYLKEEEISSCSCMLPLDKD